jgi:hypothetical protein
MKTGERANSEWRRRKPGEKPQFPIKQSPIKEKSMKLIQIFSMCLLLPAFTYIAQPGPPWRQHEIFIQHFSHTEKGSDQTMQTAQALKKPVLSSRASSKDNLGMGCSMHR